MLDEICQMTDIKVNIAHSTFVTKKERTIFYRRAIGDCNCIILYDGKDDMLLPVSHHKPKLTKTTGRRFGYKVNVVSLSLLSDYANDFFRKWNPNDSASTNMGWRKTKLSVGLHGDRLV